MVGIERTILPLLAEQEFSLALYGAILSFIVGFGVVKAIFNLIAGNLSDKFGRKPILLIGWLFGLPVPFLLIWAPAWEWVVIANLLLGVNQGLCWSTTVIMKIDLAGARQRGMAMGLNEFAGYFSVAIAAMATGYLASVYAIRPEPFYLGIAFVVAGLLLSVFFVRETQDFVAKEAVDLTTEGRSQNEAAPSKRQVFAMTSWKDRSLFCVSQAGFTNNLNDGMAWGIFPLFFAASGVPIEQIGILAAIYPASWGMLQLVTGWLSDKLGRKPFIAFGMLLQALAIWLLVLSSSFLGWAIALLLLGAGTAMVYPTLLASVGDVAHPNWRASAVGVYRFWRDSGYVAGALLAGMIADLLNIHWAIGIIGVVTLLSGLIVALFMKETLSKS